MSKIKLSTLLRNVELASLGAIRDIIAEEVERLEAVERPLATLSEVIQHDIKPDELPTQLIVNELLDGGYEWAIYSTKHDNWVGRNSHGGHTFTNFLNSIVRVSTKAEAEVFIRDTALAHLIPFPVPKLREA